MTAASSTTVRRYDAPGRRRSDQLPGGRHGLPRAVVAESQRDRLLDAMTVTAGRHGFHDAHITEVVGRAGVSRRTFYEQFDGKEDCFTAAYSRALAELAKVALAAADAHEEWVDALRAGLAALLDALVDRPEAARVCFVEVLAAGPGVTELRDELLEAFLPLFERAPTELPRDARILRSIGTGRVADLADALRREIVAGRGRELPALLGELTYLMVLPYLGPRPALRELERGDTTAGRAA